METENKQGRKVHQGYNVRSIREAKNLKQSALALMVELSQQAISKTEQKRVIDDALLAKIARALDVPVEIIENMEEGAAMSFFIENNTFEASDNAQASAGDNVYNNYCSIDEIKKIYAEKEALYEQQLKDKQAEIDFLRKLVEGKK